MIDKFVDGAAIALAGLRDGDIILVGGFGQAGMPDALVHSIAGTGQRNLTLVANGVGFSDGPIAKLIMAGAVSRVIVSFPRSVDGAWFDAIYRSGDIELELVPQGTLSERMRAAAAGLGGFLSPVSVGTRLQGDKEVIERAGRQYVLEEPLQGNVALIKAACGDRWGNLVYRKAARNFNPTMAAAATLTIAQVDEYVELGAIDPENIVTPGIFVDHVVRIGQEDRR